MAVVANVDPTGSDVGDFQYIRLRHFVLDTQIVLADQRCLDVVVVGRIKVRPGKTIEIVPPGQQSQRPVLERALQTRNVVLHGESIGVWPSFLNSVNHPVDTDAVVENTGAATHHKAAIPYRLPCETNPGSEVAQWNPVFRCEPPIKLPDTSRNRTVASLGDGPSIVVVGYYVSTEGTRVGAGRTWRYWNGP